MSTFKHPELGEISFDAKNEGVRYFRGIKYASLDHAFAEPQLTSGESGQTNDATRNGPTAISPLGACDMELSLIQHSLPHEQFSMSATECLNLNICVPTECKTPLPSFVFNHGGAFQIGSNAWPQYDLARFVLLSKELGKPVIGINVNYRLGMYGFLDSDALRTAGVKANRGIRDQKAALQWVRKYIAGFGGNSDRITVIGESAGGVSCTLHLQSEEPLFRQLVSMSGTTLLMKPLPPFVASVTNGAVLSALGIDSNASPSQQLQALLDTPVEEVLASVGPDLLMIPVMDGDIISSGDTYADLQAGNVKTKIPEAVWCDRVMFGDCKYDGGILGLGWLGRKEKIFSEFQNCLNKHLSSKDGELEAIYNGYNIMADKSPDEAMTNILSFATDVLFYVPVTLMAKRWEGSSFVYHFNEPNPWPGPWQGKASHILDVAYLFQNFNEFLTVEQQAVATSFAKDVIAFVCGESPYPAHESKEGGAQVYVGSIPAAADGASSGATFVRSEDPAAYDRSTLVWKLIQKFGWEKLSFALDMFIAGK